MQSSVNKADATSPASKGRGGGPVSNPIQSIDRNSFFLKSPFSYFTTLGTRAPVLGQSSEITPDFLY